MNKDWMYIMKYEAINQIKNDFLHGMGNKIKKIKGWEMDEKEVVIMITDIMNYVTNIGESKIMQAIIGMKYCFVGYLINMEDLNQNYGEKIQEKETVNLNQKNLKKNYDKLIQVKNVPLILEKK